MPATDVPEDKTAIPSKWVFVFKTDSEAAIQGYKARCVVQGFRQNPGEDFGDTCGSTMKDATLTLLLQMASFQKLATNQIDVKICVLEW